MREVVVNRTQRPRYPDDLLLRKYKEGDMAFFFSRRIIVRVTNAMHERRIEFVEEEVYGDDA